MTSEEMRAKIAAGQGFIAALDQSGGSTPKALKGYGVEEDAYSNDEEMFGLIHQMRSRIITSPCFSGEKVIGAILFEKTMDGDVDGKPTPAALTERGIVPFIKIDKGLEDERDGVQLMKPMPGLDELLTRAKGLGVFGTKERSVINQANEAGIAAVVGQQFEVAIQVLRHGMMPIIEPEVNIKSADRAASDAILRDEILRHLDRLPEGEQVMLKLSIPAEAGLFDAAGQASARASRRGAVGRLQPRRSLRAARQEPRHDRQLQPRAAERSASPAVGRGVRRDAGRRDRRDPRRFGGVKRSVGAAASQRQGEGQGEGGDEDRPLDRAGEQKQGRSQRGEKRPERRIGVGGGEAGKAADHHLASAEGDQQPGERAELRRLSCHRRERRATPLGKP